MNKTPLKRTSLVLMSLFAGFALVGCNPYNAQFHPDSVGYNGEIGAGARVMGAGGSSGGGASGGPNAGPTTTTSLSALQSPALNTPKIICDGQDTCPTSDDVYNVVVNGADIPDVGANFAEKLAAADKAAGQSSAPPPSNQDTDGNTSSQTPPDFYYGINGFINGGGKDITFDASNAKNLSEVAVVIGADVYNAPTINLNANATLAGNKINGNVTIGSGYFVYANSTINGNVTNDGVLFPLFPIADKPYDLSNARSSYPTPAPSSDNFIKIDKTHIASVPPVSITVNGDFTQNADGNYFFARLGTMRVNGTATVNGLITYQYTPDPNQQNIPFLLMVSPNEIKTGKSLQGRLITSHSKNPAVQEIDNNYDMSSIVPAFVQKFNMDGTSFYGLFAYTSGVPADKVTQQDYLNTFININGTLPCTEACETTVQDDQTTTADALASALPTKPMGTIQAYGGIQVPNTLFTQAINDPTKEVTFNAVQGGVGGVVFDGALTLKTLTLDYNTRTFFNGNTVTGNVVLNYSKDQESACGKDCTDNPPMLITQGLIVGNVTNNYGQVMVMQSAKELLYSFWGFGKSQAFLLNLQANDVVIPIVSFPVGLVVQGDYTQQGLYNVNLNIKSGVMFVDGQVDIQSGVIVQSYAPLQYSNFFNLLILSTHPIKVASKGVFYGHIAKSWVSDANGVSVMLSKGVYGLVNKFQSASAGNSSTQSYEAKTQSVSVKPKMSSLASALSHVKAPVINAKVLDQEGHVTARTVRVAGSSPLIQLRQTLMEASTEQSDKLEGKGVVRLQEANAATRLFLDNNSVFGLLNGVNAAPAKASSLRFDVGVDNDVLFGQKQRLANSTVLHAAVASGPVVGRVAVNFVALRQNTQLTDNVKADELSHSKGYGVNAGVQYQLPGAQGWAIAANVGFEYFNNTLNLGDKKKPAYDASVLSTTVLASNRYTLGALQAKNDVLALTPFVGYRFARQSTKHFNYSLDSYTFTSEDQAQMSNSLVAGATVQYANAFGVQGLQLGADLALDVALNNKVDHELNVMGTAFSVPGKLNSAFTAQTALSVGYKLSNVQFGAKVQLQVNSNVQGSVGGFASVSF